MSGGCSIDVDLMSINARVAVVLCILHGRETDEHLRVVNVMSGFTRTQSQSHIEWYVTSRHFDVLGVGEA